MGGVCSVVQAILTAAIIGQGGTEIAIEAMIKKLLKGKEEQFKLLDQLSGFVDKMMGQDDVLSQLNAHVLFATDNWNTIFDDLQDKQELVSKVMEKFPTVRSSDFTYKFQSGLIFAISVVGAGLISYSFYTGHVKEALTSDAATFKKLFGKGMKKIKGNAPESERAQIQGESNVEFRPISEDSPALSSNTRRIKNQEKAGGSKIGRVVLAIRILFIGVMIYQFYRGFMSLKQLVKQYNHLKKYFKDKGEFQKGEQSMVDLMTNVAADIFNLANGCQAALYDCKNFFLIKSITTPSMYDLLIGYANSMNVQKFNLDDDFIQNSKTLLEDCKKVKSSKDSLKEKLKTLTNSFSKYFAKNPEKVFFDVSHKLSQVVGEYSVISDSINQESHETIRFLTKVKELFQDYRDDDFEKEPLEEKKKIDLKILTKSLEKYNSLFDSQDTLDKLRQSTKNILFSSMISFADDFYADDNSGQTLFGFNIKENKSDTSYKDILNSKTSKANQIPVSKQSPQKEQKEVKDWILNAEKKNQAEKYKYWKKGDKIEGIHRYLRLEEESSKDKALDKTYEILVSYLGILVKVNGSFFAYEQNMMTNSTILREY